MGGAPSDGAPLAGAPLAGAQLAGAPLDRAPAAPPAVTAGPPASASGWLWPLLRICLLVGAGIVAWVVANDWDRWTGSARRIATDDAYMTGDLTPLSAKVSGYVSAVPVADFQVVHRGDLLVEIEPSDYRAQAAQAEANLQAAAANLANNDTQKVIQSALIRQARSNMEATAADVQRYHLEAERQRSLLNTRIAGTEQQVEQADANERRTSAQLALNSAQLDQQKAILDSLGIQQKQLAAQVAAAQAPGGSGAQQRRLHPHHRPGGRHRRAAAGAPWAVRERGHPSAGGDAAAEHLGDRELQGDADDQRARGPAGPASRWDAFPDLRLARPRGQLVARHRQHLRPAGAGQRHRQLHQGGPARARQDRARLRSLAGHAGAARHVRRGQHRQPARRPSRPPPASTEKAAR